MSDADGPYLFDVGVIALAHSTAPVRDSALSYVRVHRSERRELVQETPRLG